MNIAKLPFWVHLLLSSLLVIILLLQYNESILKPLLVMKEDDIYLSIFFVIYFSFFIYKLNKSFLFNSLYPNYSISIPLLVVGLLLLYIGKIAGILFFEQVSFLILLAALVLILAGWEHFRILIVPIIFLIIPLGLFSDFLASIVSYLQILTSIVSDFTINALGILSVRDGRFIWMPHIGLKVNRSCSGINHITALLVMAFLITMTFRFRKEIYKLMILVLAIVLGIIINGVRVTLIAIWALINRGNLLHGPLDILYVSFIFFIGVIILFWVAKKTGSIEEYKKQIITRESSKRQQLAGLFIVLILLLSINIIKKIEVNSIPLNSDLESIPLKIAKWQGDRLSSLDGDLQIKDPDQELIRLYHTETRDTLEIYIAYLSKQDQSREVVNIENKSLYNTAETIAIDDGNNTTFKVNYVKRISKSDHRALYFWYNINNRLISNPFYAKFYTMLDGLIKQRTNGALITIVSGHLPVESFQNDKIEHFIALITPYINSHLNSK